MKVTVEISDEIISEIAQCKKVTRKQAEMATSLFFQTLCKQMPQMMAAKQAIPNFDFDKAGRALKEEIEEKVFHENAKSRVK